MTVVLILVLVVLFVGAVIVGIALTKPSTYQVVRSATVGAPPERVYGLVEDFREWPKWSPWEDIDPNLQRTYSGADHGTGAVYAWSGDRKAGAGRMEITSAVAPSTVVIDLQFLKPFKARNVTTFSFTPVDGGTDVRWVMDGPLTFPSKVMSVFTTMDKMIGPDFEKGLGRLQTAASS